MRLLISCPNCETSYELDEKQVMEASGQVRCFNCGEVFNAIMHSEPVIGDEGTDSMHVSSLISDPDDVPPTRSSDTTEKSQANVPNSQDIESLIPQTNDITQQALGINTDDLAELEPLKAATATSPRQYSKSSTAAWLAICLLLLVIAIGQLGWQNRQAIMNNETGRSLVKSVCQSTSLPCQLPARVATDQFVILDRVIQTHPQVDGVLSMQMLLSNQAAFAQPAPIMTLSLFDASRQLVARRNFAPASYLADRPASAPLMQAGKTLKISLNLEDPGKDVTGFEFAFY